MNNTEKSFEKIVALIKAVRTVRTDMNVHPTKRTHFIIETATPDAFASGIAFLEKFAFATEVTLVDKFEGDTNGMVQVITETARAFMPLMELIDRDKELARLNSHIAQMRDYMQRQGEVGKKIDFLIQEMNREANTIGSKANDAAMAQLVVDLKSEIEKLREQIQNVE